MALLCFMCCWTGVALAQGRDDAQRRAQEELDRELKNLVAPQLARIRLDFVALDEPNYRLDEASFELDGKVLGTPAVDQLGGEGTRAIWNGEVSPGKHSIGARVSYTSLASVMMSDEGGHTWRVVGTVAFEVPAGIEVRIRVTPRRDDAQRDVSKRFAIHLPATPVMLGSVDDGTIPEPPSPARPLVASVAKAPPLRGQSQVKAPIAIGTEPTPKPKPAAVSSPRAKRRGRHVSEPAPPVPPVPQADAAETPPLSLDDLEPIGVLLPAAAEEPPDAGLAQAPIESGAPAPEGPVASQPVSRRSEDEAAQVGGLAFDLWLALVATGVILLALILVARRRARPPTL